MDMTREERELTVGLRVAKARRAYEEAKGNAAMKYWETTANRLYYAAYNAVTALLVANGDSAQTHSGVRHIFGLKFIKAGIQLIEHGQLRLQKLHLDDFITLLFTAGKAFVKETVSHVALHSHFIYCLIQ